MVHILLFESHFPGKSGFQANHCVCRVGIKRKSCSIFLTVSGCTDSAPLLSTSDCSAGGDITLTIHGVDFMSEDQVRITEGCLSAYLSVSVQKKKSISLFCHTHAHTHTCTSSPSLLSHPHHSTLLVQPFCNTQIENEHWRSVGILTWFCRSRCRWQWRLVSRYAPRPWC